METETSVANTHNQEIGRRGEDAAVRFLRMRDYEIMERNWSCPAGEVDIIAKDGPALVFVEVKTRTSFAKGFPSDAVGAKKRARYERMAAWYLKDFECTDMPVRFDVISLLVVAEDRAFLKHYVNAFGAGC